MCNVQYFNFFTLSLYTVEASTYNTIKHKVIMVWINYVCFWYFTFGPQLYTRPLYSQIN